MSFLRANIWSIAIFLLFGVLGAVYYADEETRILGYFIVFFGATAFGASLGHVSRYEETNPQKTAFATGILFSVIMIYKDWPEPNVTYTRGLGLPTVEDAKLYGLMFAPAFLCGLSARLVWKQFRKRITYAMVGIRNELIMPIGSALTGGGLGVLPLNRYILQPSKFFFTQVNKDIEYRNKHTDGKSRTSGKEMILVSEKEVARWADRIRKIAPESILQSQNISIVPMRWITYSIVGIRREIIPALGLVLGAMDTFTYAIIVDAILGLSASQLKSINANLNDPVNMKPVTEEELAGWKTKLREIIPELTGELNSPYGGIVIYRRR